MPRLVGEDASQLLCVEQLHELRVDHHDRAPGPDRQRVGDRELRQVQVRHGLQVQRRVRARMRGKDLAELVLAEAHRRTEHAASQRALVAELDDLADDRVEVRNRLQRRGGRAVGGVLVGPR